MPFGRDEEFLAGALLTKPDAQPVPKMVLVPQLVEPRRAIGLDTAGNIQIVDALTFFAGVFNGSPTGAPAGAPDPQRLDLSGTAFRVNDGVFAIFETRYNPDNSPKNGTYRLGAWYNSEKFPDQHFANNGVSLASPLSSGMPRLLANNYSVYAIIDQPIFPAKDEQDDTGWNFFGRVMGAPGDCNLVDLYFG